MTIANYGAPVSADIPPGCITRIAVDRVGGVGPWMDQATGPS